MTWCFDVFFLKTPRLRRRTSKCTRRSKKRRKQDGAYIELVLLQVTNQNAKVWWYSNKFSSRVCMTVSNSPNPSRVHIRLCKNRKKVFYCLYKITFPRNNAKLFVMSLGQSERAYYLGYFTTAALGADHLTLEGGREVGDFEKNFPASACRKKKIACSTNVIEKNSCAAVRKKKKMLQSYFIIPGGFTKSQQNCTIL